MKIEKAIPDTSVIIEGLVSRQIESWELEIKQVIVHEAVIAELESQANKNRETGFLGLEEITKLRKLSQERGFELEFKGNRPGDFEIKFAKSGEIDSLIRELARHEKGTLITADIVQSKVAEAKGIPVILYEFPEQEKKFALEKFFDHETMSVHIKEDCEAVAKKGVPGKWRYEKITDKEISREEIQELSKSIIESAKTFKDSFIEIERKGSTVIQVKNYRIVIARPPFSDGYEITAVRPVKKLELKEYELSKKLIDRILEQAEGILVAGAPGQGKSTFVQSIAEQYLSMGKNVKTVESPRDLDVPKQVTQYSLAHGSANEVNDILFLSRPDYTIFDEVRTTEDFRMFSDLRLSGIGMLGVVHASEPIDAIQRFVRRIELGMIPHVIDTVIFIKEGNVNKVFSLDIQVKVPSGMSDSDLARPIIVVHDFESGKLEFEVYSYGEEAIVVPVSSSLRNPLFDLAEIQIMNEIKKFDESASAELVSQSKCVVYVSKDAMPLIIGKKGEVIDSLEKKLGLKIDVKERKTTSSKKENKQSIKYSYGITKKELMITVQDDFKEQSIDVFVDEDFLFSAKASKKAQIKINVNSTSGKLLLDALRKGRKVEMKG